MNLCHPLHGITILLVPYENSLSLQNRDKISFLVSGSLSLLFLVRSVSLVVFFSRSFLYIEGYKLLKFIFNNHPRLLISILVHPRIFGTIHKSKIRIVCPVYFIHLYILLRVLVYLEHKECSILRKPFSAFERLGVKRLEDLS